MFFSTTSDTSSLVNCCRRTARHGAAQFANVALCE